jgi:homoserine dehydrogenase
MQNVIVLKFGSSVLRSTDDIPNIVHEIYRWYRAGHAVIAVVSAIGKTTEALIRDSRTLTESPEPFSTAELLATGERTSAALLGIALDRSGIRARVVNPREIGFEVAGTPLDSEPVSLDAARVHQLLAEHSVLVVPGFFGTDKAGRTHLLGRGGSDLTAVFLAVELQARCRLLKDVDGVYESDPADPEAHPRRYAQLNYQDALRVAGKLIQPKAVSYLARNHAGCEVAALALPYATQVHGAGTAHGTSTPNRTPLEVVILGCGTVGFGVYQRLCANPDLFRVIGVLVRERARHEAAGVPSALLYTQSELAQLKPALVVDALPGIEPSYTLVKSYLADGVDVVSANKAVIAQFGCALAEIAEESGAMLRYSAAVGGAGPMLEAVERARQGADITSLMAVLNGTCNFLLDACAVGDSLAGAIKEAQRLGFAEDDPTEDFSGRDAARKIAILARHAFGVEASTTDIQAFDDSVAEAARAAVAQGRRLRQLARATMSNGDVALSVSFELVGQDSPFYFLSGESNALSLTNSDGRTQYVCGRGAGRWPTTEAVIADVHEISCFLCHSENKHERRRTPQSLSRLESRPHRML